MGRQDPLRWTASLKKYNGKVFRADAVFTNPGVCEFRRRMDQLAIRVPLNSIAGERCHHLTRPLSADIVETNMARPVKNFVALYNEHCTCQQSIKRAKARPNRRGSRAVPSSPTPLVSTLMGPTSDPAGNGNHLRRFGVR